MQDRIPSPGKAGRVRIRQDDGTVIEGVLEMADGATQLATPLNKANLLADITAMAAGLTSSATPNEVLANLAALFPVIINKSDITYSGIEKNDKLLLADVSSSTARALTFENLASWFSSSYVQMSRISISDYTGTGAYSNQRVSVSFPFAPKLVIICRGYFSTQQLSSNVNWNTDENNLNGLDSASIDIPQALVIPHTASDVYVQVRQSYSGFLELTWSGNSLSWRAKVLQVGGSTNSISSAELILNESGRKYFVIAFG